MDIMTSHFMRQLILSESAKTQSFPTEKNVTTSCSLYHTNTCNSFSLDHVSQVCQTLMYQSYVMLTLL